MTVTVPHPLIFDNIVTFDAYLSGMEREYDRQTDSEEVQSGGYERMVRVKACLQLIRDLRATLAESMEAEAADRQQAAVDDSAENAWKQAYPDADELTLRRLAGDR